jgi:lipopolysaccharide transport system ATP-binding protein
MSPEQPAISVKDVGKAFFLYGRIRERLKDVLLGHGTAKKFWALKDISFDLYSGEALGIIGRNGSGKSTLLQIIVGTLQATHGEVSTQGRVAALLELGAGFNPEFSGRENILLNGITLGISAAEMRKREQAIIDFAQIGDYIDQPVKFYSSGMYVRLAFSIAISIEPTILVVDEALAVGDAGFVLKCMERIKELRANGCAILLVTHDIQSVRSICDRVMWIDKGEMVSIGSPFAVTTEYVRYLTENTAAPSLAPETGQQPSARTDTLVQPGLPEFTPTDEVARWGSGRARIKRFSLAGDTADSGASFEHGCNFRLVIEVGAEAFIPSGRLGVGFSFRNLKGLDIITSNTWDAGELMPDLMPGERLYVSFELKNILAPGDYGLALLTEDRSEGAPKYYDFIDNAMVFSVFSTHPIYSLVLPDIQLSINVHHQEKKPYA